MPPILQEIKGCYPSFLESYGTSFDDLYQRVAHGIGSITGIGLLTIYDTALRIGAFLKLEPDLIYLHRGTGEGAKAILPISRHQKTLTKEELPEPFSKLKPHEIEDCLCIYKDSLQRISNSKSFL